MSLLVGTVYRDHPRSLDWYKLQIKYLNKSTKNFTHLVYLNGKNNFYDQSHVIKIDQTPIRGSQIGQRFHIRGLNFIIDYFNKNDQFKNLLLLDSDCFPFHPNWEDDLLSIMKDFGVAALCRYENLDLFAHPAFFYVKRQFSLSLKFNVCFNQNIIGFKFKDTSSNIKKFLPLIRTNRLNLHPVLCGVYWNRFYHHGAGSRDLSFRLFYSYFNNNTNVSAFENKMFNELVKDSDKFIGEIAAPIFDKKIF